MRPLSVALLFALSVAGAALGADISVKDEMKTVVDPAATTIFAVGGEVDPANGPDAAKVPAGRWAEALAASQKLKVAAVYLAGPQQQPGEVWTKSAADFAKLADDAVSAAAKQDGAAFSKAANDLGDVCTACHSKYKNQG